MKSYDYFNYAPYLGHMQFGISGGDANFLVLFTCHGGEYNVWLEYGWDAAMGAGQMNQILAFHGTAYTYSGIDDDFEEFMAHSCCSHIGDRWVEHASYSMYKENPTGGDNCPVVMGWGKSHAAIEYAIYQYQAFLNFKDKTPADYSHYYFVEECEADDVVGEDLPEESPVEDRD